MAGRMALELMGQTNPAVPNAVRRLAGEGHAPEQISRILFRDFNVTLSRTAIAKWLSTQDDAE